MLAVQQVALVICFLGALLALISHGLFLVMLCKKKQRKLSDNLLAALSAVDIAEIFLCIPAFATSIVLDCFQRECSHQYVSSVAFASTWWLGTCNALVIGLIASEKYTNICHPYWPKFMTSTRVFYFLIFYSAISCTIAFVFMFKFPLFWGSTLRHLYSAICIFCYITTIICYVRIFCVSKRISAQISSVNRVEGIQIRRKARAARTGLYIWIGHTMAYLPTLSRIVLEQAGVRVSVSGQMLIHLVFLLNPLTDGLVYLMRMKWIRRAIGLLVSGRNSNMVNEPVTLLAVKTINLL